MKPFLQVVVFSTVVFCVFQTINGSSMPCLGKNPFLQKLSQSKRFRVKIENTAIERPKLSTGWPKCRNEWTTHGSCCDLDSLLEYATIDKQFIFEKMNQLKSGILDIFEKLKLFIPSLDRIASNKAKTLKALVRTISKIQKENPNLVISNLNASISVMKSLDVKECSDELSKFRGSALCDICAGNSERYFLTGKALIPTNVCLDLYSKCEFQVSAPTIFMASLLKNLKLIYKRSVLNHDSEECSDGTNFGVPSQMAMMASMLKSANHTLGEKIEFCEKLIRLVDEPRFFAIQSEQAEIINYIHEITQNFARIETELLKSSSAIKRLRRRLQSSPFGDQPSLSGDLIVIPIDPHAKVDSAYKSFIGAIGTNINEASHHHLRPMNLTSLLP